MYGNIGVPGRLEFTVIGSAVNEAARLEGLCKELGHSIIISSTFPRCYPSEMLSLGHHRLRGISEPQEVFTLGDEIEPMSQDPSCSSEAGGCRKSLPTT